MLTPFLKGSLLVYKDAPNHLNCAGNHQVCSGNLSSLKAEAEAPLWAPGQGWEEGRQAQP